MEFWLNEVRPCIVSDSKAYNRKWMGLGVPYHLPIMMGMFLIVVCVPLYPFTLSDIPIAIGEFFYGLLLEDFGVQVIELYNGYGWIRKNDWSSKFGWFPFYKEYVIPNWYLIFLLIISICLIFVL